MAVKLETDAIRNLALFEKVTKVHAKDCLITDNCIYFLVDSRKVGLAIGKNGSTIKEVSRVLGRQVRIFGHADSAEETMKSIVPNLRDVKMENGSMMVSIQPKDRLAVIGRNGETIKVIRQILKRHFKIENLKLRM
ncbi:MAG: NusA-like transcription termination signal-binding factor [Candidatus Aenigmatarchaeota archaeon]